MRLRAWPDTLVGRTLLVLFVGLVLSQLAAVSYYYSNRMETLHKLGGQQTAERIAAMVKLIESTPVNERVRTLRAMDMPGLRIGWGQDPVVALDRVDNPDESLYREIALRLPDHPVRTGLFVPPPPPPLNEPAPGAGLFRTLMTDGTGFVPALRVAVLLSDGSWLNFAASERVPDPLSMLRTFGPLTAGFVVVLLLSVVAVRRSTRPLGLLAAAAERLGRDVTAPPMSESGPREVRAAAHAFNEMQTRLRRFVEDRTQMVAAISHDLRTPITRLKLRAEFVDDEDQRARMLSDLDEMEEMISATLNFARGEAAQEPRRPVDLANMLAELAGNFGVTYAGPDRLVVQAGPTTMKRAFTNLLENSAKYAGRATVALSASGKGTEIVVDDDGPGIPQGEREKVFQPFYRIENSRNRETGGAGLGLAVARSAIRAHGGDIILSDRPGGGLRANVILPA